jgi:plastocyanin
MRALTIGSSCLLLIPLLVSSGCGNSAYVQKGPETYTNTVKISNCKADPDTALVHKGDTLTWTVDPVDGHTYSVKFPKGKPFSSSTIPPGQGQNVTGDTWCNTLGWISPGFCKYGYDVIQDPDPQNHGTKCPDPGVHVH